MFPIYFEWRLQPSVLQFVQYVVQSFKFEFKHAIFPSKIPWRYDLQFTTSQLHGRDKTTCLRKLNAISLKLRTPLQFSEFVHISPHCEVQSCRSGTYQGYAPDLLHGSDSLAG